MMLDPEPRSLPVVVAGMHRSGTSVTAALIQDMGVNVGSDLLAPDPQNPRGYFEDIEFLELQREIVNACCNPSDPGWPDWGWTETEQFETDLLPGFRDRAEELASARTQRHRVWGWKDPRTSLLLDFWDEILPNARYVFVYREPWEVLNSVLNIENIESTPLGQRSDYVPRIWHYYNRHILRFYRNHQERCVLFHVGAMREEPQRLLDLIANKLELPFDAPASEAAAQSLVGRVFDESLLHRLDGARPDGGSIVPPDEVYAALLTELDTAADLPRTTLALSSPAPRHLGGGNQARASSSAPTGRARSRDAASNDAPPTDGRRRRSRTRRQHGSVPNEPGDQRPATPEMSTPRGAYREGVDVSVIIPCFNQGEFLLEAIASVEACEAPVYEIVVVDDGSDDPATRRILRRLSERGYFVLEQPNRGLADARNAGIRAAHGRYLLPLDSDNRVRPDYLTKGIEILDTHPNVGAVYSDAQLFGDEHGIREVGALDLERLLPGNYIDACAVLRRELWEQCGGYATDMPRVLGWQDWDLWLSAIEHGWELYYVNEPLYEYQVRADSMSRRDNLPAHRRALMRYIAQKHAGLFAERLPHILGMKEYELARLEIDCRAAEASIEGLRGENAQVVQALNTRLSECDAHIHALNLQIQQRDESVRALTGAVDALSSQLVNRGSQHEDQTVAQLTAQLSERNAHVHALNLQIQQSDKAVRDLTAAVESLSAQVTERDGSLQETYAELAGRNAHVNEQNEQLAAQEHRLQELADELAATQALVAAMTDDVRPAEEQDRLLAERDERIAELQNMVSQRERNIAARAWETTNLRSQIVQLQQDIAELQARLAGIYGSRTWAVARKVWSARSGIKALRS